MSDPDILAALPGLEKRFDANTQRFQSRIEKIKARSHMALIDLGIARRRFDLVYVDGGHEARDVYGDAVLSWSLDDYEWDKGTGVKVAVDAFCWNFINECIVVHRGYQLIVRKV